MSWLPVARHEYHSYYQAAKVWYMRLGREYEAVFAEAVGGARAVAGEGCDVVTPLGKWEFCASNNTKNSAGLTADITRVGPGRCVCVTGRPPPGWLTAAQFLEAHGIPTVRAGELAAEAERRAGQFGRQMELTV